MQRPAETALHPTVFAVERLLGLSDALLGPRSKEDTMGSTEEEIRAKALLRYFVISAYLAADPVLYRNPSHTGITVSPPSATRTSAQNTAAPGHR